jgi:transcriptional regulator with XRE-family HTH domain
MFDTIEKPKIMLAAARVNAGMTQKELAKYMDVDISTITNWEKGKSEPSTSQLRKISQVSGIPMDYIFVPEQS